MQPNRVLLAHRDPAVQELATRALTHLGVTVDIAVNPLDAVDPIAITPDGYTVVVMHRDDTLLTAIKNCSPRPMVIVTAPADDHDAFDAETVSLFIPEPYDPQTVVGVILACVTPELATPLAISNEFRATSNE